LLIIICFRVSARGEAVNYRPFASPSIKVPKPRKLTARPAIIIIIIIIKINKHK